MSNNRIGDIAAVMRRMWAVTGWHGDVDLTMVQGWSEILHDMTAAQIGQALITHSRDPKTGMFAPKPADIIRIISGTGQADNLIAWTKVERAIKDFGAYQSIVFDDPKIHAVIDDMGGWLDLCQTAEKEMPYKQNEFCNRYDAYKGRQLPSTTPNKLIGMFEAENMLEYSDKVKPPILIGDEQQCLLILERKQTQMASMIESVIGRLK